MIPTKAILRTANIKVLTVLGIIPVEKETMSADKETQVKAKIMLYVVEELRYTIISKVTLEALDIILKYFPQPSPRQDYAQVARFNNLASLSFGSRIGCQ